jgi:hypothetical protein
MTALGPEDVLRFAESWFPSADTPFTLLASIRRHQPRFVGTFLSARAATEELPAQLAGELAAVRSRQRWLAEIEAVVRRQVPGLAVMKGSAVAAEYPPGLVRDAGDIDLVAGDAATAWRAAEVAAAEVGVLGTTVSTFPLRCGQPPTGLLVTVEGLPEHPLTEPPSLDITTHAVVGDGSGVPAWTVPPGVSFGLPEHMLAVAAERLEGPFTAKDVLDGAVLAGRLDDRGELGSLVPLAVRARLVPEVAELLELGARHGLPMPGAALVSRAAVRRARAARHRDQVRCAARHPAIAALRFLQSAETYPVRWAGPRQRWWRMVDRLMPVKAPVRAALVRHGLPVEISGDTDRPVLRSTLGDYLLVNAADVAERWFDSGLALRED